MLKEEKQQFIELLNSPELQSSYKLWLIEHNKIIVNDISDITEKTLWQSIFEQNKITTNWDSIIEYYSYHKNILDTVITNYINEPENCRNLYSLELPTIEENSSSLFIHSILESNNLNDQIYAKVIQEIKHKYNSLDICNLNKNKVELLISHNVLLFSTENISSCNPP